MKELHVKFQLSVTREGKEEARFYRFFDLLEYIDNQNCKPVATAIVSMKGLPEGQKWILNEDCYYVAFEHFEEFKEYLKSKEAATPAKEVSSL